MMSQRMEVNESLKLYNTVSYPKWKGRLKFILMEVKKCPLQLSKTVSNCLTAIKSQSFIKLEWFVHPCPTCFRVLPLLSQLAVLCEVFYMYCSPCEPIIHNFSLSCFKPFNGVQMTVKHMIMLCFAIHSFYVKNQLLNEHANLLAWNSFFLMNSYMQMRLKSL